MAFSGPLTVDAVTAHRLCRRARCCLPCRRRPVRHPAWCPVREKRRTNRNERQRRDWQRGHLVPKRRLPGAGPHLAPVGCKPAALRAGRPYASFVVDCHVAGGASASEETERVNASDDCSNANIDTQSLDFGLSGGWASRWDRRNAHHRRASLQLRLAGTSTRMQARRPGTVSSTSTPGSPGRSEAIRQTVRLFGAWFRIGNP